MVCTTGQYTCSLKCCKYIKNTFFSPIDLQVVCNIPAKYKHDKLKALEGVDYTKYAILAINRGVVENLLS